MNLYRRLLHYVKPYRLHLIGSIFSAAMVSATTAGYAWLVRPIMDDVFIRKDEEMLVLIPIATMLVALLKGFFTYAQAYLMRFSASWVISDIRQALYQQMLLLPVGFHIAQPTGQLISRIIHDVHVMQDAVSTVVKDIFQQSLTLIGLMAVIFYQDWQLALFAVFVMPLMIYPIVRIGERLRKIARKGQERAGDLTNILQETFSGIRIVKAFGKEGFEADRFSKKNREYFKTIVRAVSVGEAASPLAETILSIAIAGVLWYGGSRVISGEMTPGTFFSFIAAVSMMYGPIKSLSRANNQLQQALSAAERVFRVLDMKNEHALDRGKKVLPEIKGYVTFCDVGFHYAGTESDALKDINIQAKPGDIVALVGSSGAGKSTLINLIPRFFDVSQGEILMDGVPIQDVTLSSLRRQIGIVSQEIVLFDDTILWNIAYGFEGASKERIIQAAKAAYADAFIRKLPKGYDTLVEKGGANLSGGERQRLAIARALLKDPPILILDEATSALDTESEFVVRKALAKLMKNRTTFVIAHRLSTVQRATCIVVIDQGCIVELGTHEALIRKNGAYRKVYQMQFSDMSGETQGDTVGTELP
ncbi:MAG: lipid A export permease/ATP-binding protein MsbA [Nitrospiria bacterium]